MQPNARVMRDWQLYAAGPNATGLTAAKVAQCAASGPSCSPVAAQIRQNAAVMEKVLRLRAARALALRRWLSVR